MKRKTILLYIISYFFIFFSGKCVLQEKGIDRENSVSVDLPATVNSDILFDSEKNVLQEKGMDIVNNDSISSPPTVYSDILSNVELERNKLNAMKGDGEAANIVARHFSFGKNDYYTGIFWYLIGTENGYLASQYSLVILLLNNRNDKDFFLAVFFGCIKWRLSVTEIPRNGC